MYCVKCGAEIDDNAIACPKCGVPTKNFKRKAPVQSTINVTGPAAPQHQSTIVEAWKFAVGLIVILFGASAFLQGWKAWSWGVLAASMVAILGGAMLFAWGIVNVRAKLKKKKEDEEIYL